MVLVAMAELQSIVHFLELVATEDFAEFLDGRPFCP